MGYSEEFYYKSEYKRLWAILKARNDYYKDASAGMQADNEAQAYRQLDSFLG